MMQRPVHITPAWFIKTLRLKPGAIADSVIVSGQKRRAELCRKKLKKSRKVFSLAGCTFWTGIYIGKEITVGNAGLTSPETAFILEILAALGAKEFIRIGSCGSLKAEIAIGDLVLADSVLVEEGTSQHYLLREKAIEPNKDLLINLKASLKSDSVYQGRVVTTDAVFKETKDTVNRWIAKNAIAVDMVTSAFLAVAQSLEKKACAVLAVSDNLITGEMGFSDKRYHAVQETVAKAALDVFK